MRKFADLESQYERSITDLLQKQKVDLVKLFDRLFFLQLFLVHFLIVFKSYL